MREEDWEVLPWLYKCQHTDYPSLTYKVLETRDTRDSSEPLYCGTSTRFLWWWTDPPTFPGTLGESHMVTVCAKVL